MLNRYFHIIFSFKTKIRKQAIFLSVLGTFKDRWHTCTTQSL